MTIQSLSIPADGGQPPTAPSQSDAGSSPSATQAAPRPEWAPESHWDADKGTFKDTFGAHYSEIATARQAEADRLASLPKTPDEYKFQIPAELPEGVTAEGLGIDEKNPLLRDFRSIAHEEKLTPAQAQKFVDIKIKHDLAQMAAHQALVTAELKKLGPNHAQRLVSLHKAVEANIGKEFADELLGERGTLFTAKAIQGIEAFIAKISGHGAASPPGNGADNNPPPVEKTTAELWYGATTPQRKAG